MEKEFEKRYGISFEDPLDEEEELDGQTTLYDWTGGELDE